MKLFLVVAALVAVVAESAEYKEGKDGVYHKVKEEKPRKITKTEYIDASFQDMDRNHDEFLTAGEMREFVMIGFKELAKMDSTREFKNIDKNGDKYVTWAEITADRFKKTPEALDTGIKEGTMKRLDALFVEYDKAKFAICDKNGDGKLSAHEHYYNLNSNVFLPVFELENMWLEYDANRDGKVMLEELMALGGKPEDQSEEEFRKGEKGFFDSRDLNKDGILEYSEIKEMIQPDRKKQADEHIRYVFEHVDTNKDERLSKKEYDNSYEQMSLFENVYHNIPEPLEGETPGPPQDAESRIDFALYSAEGQKKDEL